MISYPGPNLLHFTGNTIGSMSATGSISYTNSTTSTTSVSAMYNFGSSNWLNVSNNNIGGITAANTNVVPAAANIYGIRVNTAAAAPFTALNNTIGGTIANSIQHTSTNTGSIVNGIISTTCIPAAYNNTIRNLSAANGTNLAGIVVTSTAANATVSGNTISALTNTNTGAGAFAVNGISFTGTNGVQLIRTLSMALVQHPHLAQRSPVSIWVAVLVNIKITALHWVTV